MNRADGIITFKEVTFAHDVTHPIVDEVNFSIRRGAKLALMGQNGAGKSTLFKLMTGALRAEEGTISTLPRTTVATARQVIPRQELELTVREFFAACFTDTVYDIDPRIDTVLEVVHLSVSPNARVDIKDRVIGTFSGGQQARLLLASALIQEPDVLLLDEPTNNLDVEGIAHLTEFLEAYRKTVVVISHDAEFLNAFTDGVLYLDVHTRQVEKYDGNYHDVVKEIARRIQKEQRQNAQLEKEIKANKEKINYFSNKGGGMRMVAKRMRDKVEESESARVQVRKEDATIRDFIIPVQAELPRAVVHLTSFQVIKNDAPKIIPCDISIDRGEHVHMVGPNGIGKTTLLEHLATGAAEGEYVAAGVRIGYYRQDFSNLRFDQTVYDSLMASMREKLEEKMRSIAAGFLLRGDVLKSTIGDLSEGQKGLVAFAKLVMEEPGLLILDEPTNHINFRHLPVIGKALHDYKGAMIVVSHAPEFIADIHIDTTLDLEKLQKKAR